MENNTQNRPYATYHKLPQYQSQEKWGSLSVDMKSTQLQQQEFYYPGRKQAEPDIINSPATRRSRIGRRM